MVVGMLGILLAGGVYSGVASSTAFARMATIASETKAGAGLTTGALVN